MGKVQQVNQDGHVLLQMETLGKHWVRKRHLGKIQKLEEEEAAKAKANTPLEQEEQVEQEEQGMEGTPSLDLMGKARSLPKPPAEDECKWKFGDHAISNAPGRYSELKSF